MYKKLIYLASVVLALGVQTLSAEGLDDYLVLHLPFDEGAGAVANDTSNTGLQATLEGNYQWTTGKYGSAVDFTTAQAVVSESDPLNLPQLTVMAWINPTSIVAVDAANHWTDLNTIYCKAGPGAADTVGLFLTSGDGLLFHLRAGGNQQMFVRDAGVQTDQWQHLAGTYDGTVMRVFLDGEQVGEQPVTGDIQSTSHQPRIGGRGDQNIWFDGAIDDVKVFNRGLTPEEIQQAMKGSESKPWPYASSVDPEDGDMLESTWMNLSWQPGHFAVSHDVYIGENFDDVNDGTGGTLVGNQATTTLVVGFPGFPIPDGLVPGNTYYWRIDEVNEADPNSPWKGDVWSFWIQPRKAYDSSPADSTKNVLQDVTLSWAAGVGAALHYVYFGENFDDVNNATEGEIHTETTYNPAMLELDKTYYWRVDEVDTAGATLKGDVWSFTTVPDVPALIEDPNLAGFWKVDEGQYITAIDVSGNNRHGVLHGDVQWTDGHELGALEFYASGDYVNINGYKGVLATDGVQHAFTIACWFKTIGKGVMVSWGSSSSDQSVFLHLVQGRLRVDHGGSNLQGDIVCNDGQWHHAVLTVDKGAAISTPGTKLWLDGVLDVRASTAGDQATYNITAGADVCIGCRADKSNFFPGLIDEVRIYDKVLTAEEIAQIMIGNPKLAGSPMPDREAVVDIRDVTSLNWSAADTAASHDVYFGTDRDTLEFKGNQTGTSLSLSDLVEFGGGDYYWRIDEVEADGTVTAGTIWKFTVPDYLIVDNFESYNNIEEDQPGSNRVYMTWIDGYGTTTNGAVAGNLDPPFTSQGRNSAKAMPLSYDNAGKTSEVTRTFTPGKDWTEQDVTKLVIWFSGDAANAADRMYVALGNAVVYHPDDTATQDGGWNEWVIELQEFANQGADMTNVGSITIGFGTRGVPVATGGAGTVEIDDIRLIR